MSSLWERRIIVVIGLLAFLSACGFDPNARKQKYFESGQRDFEKGDYQAAAIEYTNAIKIDPSFAEAHFRLAEIYLKSQQTDRAYKELLNTTDLRPGHYQARLMLANLLITTHRIQEAQQQCNLLLSQRPDDPAVHSTVSSLMAVQGNISGALVEMRRTIALAPESWQPYLALSLLQMKNGEADAAQASLNTVIRLNPNASAPRVLLGTWYQTQKRFQEAEQQFQNGIAAESTSLAPRQALAGLYVAEGKNAVAEQVLKQAVTELPEDPESYLALSNFYFVSGNFDAAVSVYRTLYERHPADNQIAKKYIQLLIQVKRYSDASSLDDAMLKRNPGDDDALLCKGQIQLGLGHPGQAADILQRVVTDAPNDADAHYSLGVAFAKQGYPDRAQREWLEALRLNPDSPDPERAIADAAMRRGDMNALREAANQLIRLEPSAAEGYALRGLSSIDLGQEIEAESDIRKAIEVAPQSPLGYVQMGNLRFTQKRYSESLRAYQSALDRNPTSIDALRGVVNASISQDQLDNAISIINAQITKSPDNSDFYGLLGSVLYRSKHDLSAAEPALAKAVALDPHNVDAVMQLCEVRADKGDKANAIATAEQFLRTNSRQTPLVMLLGNLYETQRDWNKAQDVYQDALAIDSTNPVASNDLARVMLHTGGNFDVALSLAQTARQQLPESPGVIDNVGWIYYQKGAYPLAISTLQQALSVLTKHNLPDNADIQFHLAMAYEKAQQTSLARKHFESVLKIDPSYPGADEVKKELMRLDSSPRHLEN